MEEITLCSTEVAEMLETAHKTLLRKIEGDKTHQGIIEIMTQHQMVPSEYFIKSTYKDASGKENECYQITKKGCELLAHKTTGEKGTIFSVRYIDRFHQMESILTADSYMIADPITRAKKWIEEEERRQQLLSENKNLIEENNTLRPKAEFHDAIMTSDDCITVEAMAKILSSTKVSIGQNRLYRWLRENKYLKCNNLPYQIHMNSGMFAVQETPYFNQKSNATSIRMQTVITPKGQKNLVKIFKKLGGTVQGDI